MPRTLRSLAALTTLAALAACGEERDPRAISAVTSDLAPVVEGNNDFAWKLYGAASHGQGNLFFSPFSVSAAFGMTLAGAGGETATEMHDVLGLKTDDTAYHASFGALVRDLGGEHPGRGYQLYVADRLFGEKGSTFDPAFLALVKSDYGAPLDTVDYGAPDAAVGHINGWVATATQKKIPELLSPDLVDANTRLVLANAIYFKADWATQFDASKTQKMPFTRIDGTAVDADLMWTEEIESRVAFDPDGTTMLLDLDYKDDELSMTILLPTEPSGFPALESKLTRAYVDQLIASEQKEKVSILLPRWEQGLELPLGDLLVGMGMKRAFDPELADFSKISTATGPLYLGFAVHKAYVKVDEQGTEAAAATANGLKALSAPPSFYANHAFVYLIRDRLTGSILFMGRMDDPTAKGTL